jgi:uncharacterized protein (TIGR00369 family)
VSQQVRTRRIEWEDPFAAFAELQKLSGLEALRAMIDGKIAPPPITVLLDFALVDAGDGFAVFEGNPAEYHYNPIGVVHGGYMMTLLDSALGCAVLSKLPLGVGYTTIDTQVRFIRPVTKDSGVLRCEGRIIHVGRTTGVSEAKLTNAAGKIVASGTSACAILR